MVDSHMSIDDDEDDTDIRPEELDKRTMYNVVAGALLDNIGSCGLVPLCLSPLALEQYNLDLQVEGVPVIMSITSYKWLTVLLSLMVVPSILMTPQLFKRIGAAGTCVFGNVFTACITVALLAIGNGPATQGYYIAFVAVLYGGFPFTVFSQLTTGPMLDVLAPQDKIGCVQGLNNMAMNFGMAFAPWLLGLLADATTTNTAIWTGVGISFGAAMVNRPLTCHEKMKKQEPKIPGYRRILKGEDKDIVNLALTGENVDRKRLFEINRKRMVGKKALLIPKVKPYAEDKESFKKLAKHAGDNIRFKRDMSGRVLGEIADDTDGTKREKFAELISLANGREAETEGKEEARDDLGHWIGEYLVGNGYNPHMNPILIKQMVLTAFPPIAMVEECTPGSVEERALKWRQNLNRYVCRTRDRWRPTI